MLYILKYVSEKNPRKGDGITPLHSAAYRGHLEACKVLMEAASDKEPSPTRDGLQKPAFYAMQNNHDKVVKYIAEYLRKDNLQRTEGWLTRANNKINNWLGNWPSFKFYTWQCSKRSGTKEPGSRGRFYK